MTLKIAQLRSERRIESSAHKVWAVADPVNGRRGKTDSQCFRRGSSRSPVAPNVPHACEIGKTDKKSELRDWRYEQPIKLLRASGGWGGVSHCYDPISRCGGDIPDLAPHVTSRIGTGFDGVNSV